MALSKDKALCFRKGGTTYTYYGYTTPPSGHYIGFRSGGVTRYVPLANNTNGELKDRIAGSTYSVTRQTASVILPVSIYNRRTYNSFGAQWISTGYVTFTETNKGSLSKTFTQDITVAVQVKLSSAEQLSSSMTVTAGSTTFGKTESVPVPTQKNGTTGYNTQCRLVVTAFGQTFYGSWASHNGGASGTTASVNISASISI